MHQATDKPARITAKLLIALGIATTVLLPGISWAETRRFIIDHNNQQMVFEVGYFGISKVRGRFDKVDATFDIDRMEPAASKVLVTINTISVDTRDQTQNSYLRGEEFFNALKYPAMTFESTGFDFNTPTSGRVLGNLTLLDVTRPISLDFKLTSGQAFLSSPDTPVRSLGFLASGEIKRSNWGMNAYIGPVSDTVTLDLRFNVIDCIVAPNMPDCANVK